MSKPELFSIWEEPFPLKQSLPWRVQLVNYIGCFSTKESAESYIMAVMEEREKAGIKIE